MSLTQKLSTEFRQQCESIATELRAILDLRAFDPLPATVLAKRLETRIFTPEEIPNVLKEQVDVLLKSDQWSAAIIRTNPLWIVHNPRHAQTRQQSNLMHELAHILMGHKMVGFDRKTGLPQRREGDEDEATYLGGCLQIPQRGLLWAVQRKMSLRETAIHFGASEEMVQFRCNVTTISIEKESAQRSKSL
jgi:Zn-dependent peptidase ImmA (M78 family)